MSKIIRKLNNSEELNTSDMLNKSDEGLDKIIKENIGSKSDKFNEIIGLFHNFKLVLNNRIERRNITLFIFMILLIFLESILHNLSVNNLYYIEPIFSKIRFFHDFFRADNGDYLRKSGIL